MQTSSIMKFVSEHPTNDQALVFTLEEAVIEIRDLRAQKALMLKALKEISGLVGGIVGDTACRALLAIEYASNQA